MNSSKIAITLIGVGIVMILVGIVDAAGSGNATETVAAGSTTVIATSTSATVTPTTTTAPIVPTTTSTLVMTTVTVAPPVATTTSTTSTTAAPTATVESVEDFVQAFAAAIAAGDVDFLFDRLHPAVVGGFGPALCRSWIEGEILLLGEYKLSGPVEGPRDQSFTTPAGTGTISNAFAAPVSFIFQGQSFDGDGGFALVGNDMFWLGQCR